MNNIVTGEKAAAMIGGHYNMILIAAARAREVSAERRKEDQQRVKDGIPLDGTDRKAYVRSLLLASRKSYGPSSQALSEIEQGVIGKEYLQKLKK
jgi:DNA-directed RNA polymerase subunit K/omega